MKIRNFLQTKKQKKHHPKSHIPTRLNILFAIAFLSALALIGQLAYLQIVHGETFKNKIAQSTEKIVVQSTPRGSIYDAKGKVIVGNKAIPAITYTKGSGTSTEEMKTVAKKLVALIDVPEDKGMTKRDYQDFFLADKKNYNEVLKRVPKKEQLNKYGDYLGSGVIYQKVVDKVTDDEIALAKEEEKAATLFKRMNGAYALTTIYLKNDGVTDKEIALIGEQGKDLPGVSAGMDWQREYPYEETLRSLLGTVSTEKTGLPQELADKYLALGYAMNDRVGTSFLEEQYEQALQGVKMQNVVEMNNKGQITNQVQTFAGKKGENLVTTIDIEFQKEIEGILKRHYERFMKAGMTTYSDGVYAVVMNPNNGDVLSVAGIDHDLKTNKLTVNPLGAINNVFVPGSVIKGATVAAGFKYGVLTGNNVFIDEPLQFKGTPTKSSIFNRGSRMSMDLIRALGESSNVYMMQIALRMLGTTYTPNMQLPVDFSLFDKLRNVYSEFGLGSGTGLDIPHSSKGLVTPTRNFYEADGKTVKPGTMGLGMDLSYGNYDNYTVMQLAQYVSTIATSGKRYAPRFVKGINQNDENGNLGAVAQNFPPKLLNKVELTPAQWQLIHDGFYATTHAPYGTAANILSQSKLPEIAAKTGTAESFYYPGDGKQHAAINSSIVAYAPAKNPQVAIAVMVPRINGQTSTYNQEIAKDILDAYHSHYPQ